jgi:hypothetical protein
LEVRLVDLSAFLAGTAALAALVLTVYDTALLYNLAHVARDWPMAAGCLTLIVVARTVVARTVTGFASPRRPVRPGLAVLVAGLRWLLVLFFVPALPLRYGMGYFGSVWAIVAAGAVLIVAGVAAVWQVGRVLVAVVPRRAVVWWAGELLAAVAGAAAAGRIAEAWPGTYPEWRLLDGALAATTTMIVILYVGDLVAGNAVVRRSG